MGSLKKKRGSGGKKLKAPQADIIPADQQYPVFSFKYLQEDEFGIKSCNPVAFVSQLIQVSQLTWGQWKQCHREGMGFEKIERASVNPEIPQVITNDVKHFLSFRFTDGRVIGYRDRTIFYIVWTDGKFAVYDH